MNNDLLTTGNDHPKPGYKQTEVGVIPEDWNVVTIREITSLVTNGFVGKATDHYTDRDDGITYIQGYNVEANSFNFNGIKKVTPEFHRIHQKSCVRKDDLLTIQTGEVGLTTIVPDSLVGSNCHALIISRFKKERALPWFYAHYFNSPMGRLRLRDLEVGTTMMHINVGELLPWEVPCPPKLEEQRSIAKALSDVDALIAALDKAIAKKRHLKTATMQQLLTGKKRLPGFGEGKGYQKTEVGVIPEDWAVKSIGDIAEVKTGPFGSALHEKDYVIDGTPIITVEHLSELGVEHINLPMVSDEDRNRLKTYSLKLGDIVFSRVGSIDRNALIKDSESGWLFSGRLLRVRLNSLIDNPQYLSYHFHSEPFKRRVREVAVGQTMASLNTQILKGIQIILPLKKEQRAISTVLSDMDAEIAALETRLAKTQALKQGMMQALLTGRVRLV